MMALVVMILAKHRQVIVHIAYEKAFVQRQCIHVCNSMSLL